MRVKKIEKEEIKKNGTNGSKEIYTILDTSALIRMPLTELYELSNYAIIPYKVLEEFQKYTKNKESVEKLKWIYTLQYSNFRADNEDNLEICSEVDSAFILSNATNGRKRFSNADRECVIIAGELQEMGFNPIIFTSDKPLLNVCQLLGINANTI